MIPVHKRLAAILKETPRQSEFILNNRWGRPYKNGDALSGVIKRVLTEDLKNAAHLTTHGLRKNAGVALAEAECTVSEIMAILGHKTPAITYKLYGHVLSETEQQAADVISFFPKDENGNYTSPFGAGSRQRGRSYGLAPTPTLPQASGE